MSQPPSNAFQCACHIRLITVMNKLDATDMVAAVPAFCCKQFGNKCRAVLVQNETE
jgi:hypothetical protein